MIRTFHRFALHFILGREDFCIQGHGIRVSVGSRNFSSKSLGFDWLDSLKTWRRRRRGPSPPRISLSPRRRFIFPSKVSFSTTKTEMLRRERRGCAGSAAGLGASRGVRLRSCLVRVSTGSIHVGRQASGPV